MSMVSVQPVAIHDRMAVGIEVRLPKTTLLIVATDLGYIMCGALDVNLLNEKLPERKIVAGRAVGVRTLDELLEAPLESVTYAAEERGIHPGMKGREAVARMFP